MSLRAGRLRERLALQAISSVPDGAGGNTQSWANFASDIPAEIEPLAGGEAFRQGMANATQFYRITIRFRAGVTPRNRIWWNGQALNIRTCADPDNRRESLVITAESGAAEP